MTGFDQDTSQGIAESIPGGIAQANTPQQQQQQIPGLPPTAMAMQMQSLQNEQQQQQQQAAGAQMGGFQPGGPRGQMVNADYGRSSLKDLAERLARGYGLKFGPGELVDAQGQFLQTPDQMGAGGDLSDTAANMNLVAQAINERQIQQQQNKATAALQAGAGLIQQRGTGSLAGMQSGFYQGMAQIYTDPNLLPEQQDFSFWIQKDQLTQAEADRAAEGSGGGGGGGGTLESDMKLQQDLAAQQQAAQQAQANYDAALQQARNSSRSQQTMSNEVVVPTYKPYIPGGY